MSIYINDPFTSMPSGPGIPGGWTLSFGSGTVKDFSNQGQYPVFKWYDNQGFLVTPELTTSLDISLLLGFRIPGYTGNYDSIITMSQKNTLGVYIPFLKMGVEGDRTITFNAGQNIAVVNKLPQRLGSPFLCSSGYDNNFFFSYDTWYYLQLDIGISPNLPTQPLGVAVSAYIEGFNITGGGTTVNLFPGDYPSLIAPTPFLDIQFTFAPPAGGEIDLCQIYLADSSGMSPIYPHPATPPAPHLRTSQIVAETSVIPVSENIRVSQAVNELAKLPSSQRIRVSQLVIELPAAVATGGSGWIVKEV